MFELLLQFSQETLWGAILSFKFLHAHLMLDGHCGIDSLKIVAFAKKA